MKICLRQPCRGYERGFTLLEIMVALGVFALAAVLWFRVLAGNSESIRQVEAYQLALWTAQNQMLLAQSGFEVGPQGRVRQGGRWFSWSLLRQETEEPGFDQLRVVVQGAEPAVRVMLTGYVKAN